MSMQRNAWRRAARAAELVMVVAAVTSCRDGLFVEPAHGPAQVSVSYTLSEAARIVAGGPAAAYDAADALRVRLLQGEAARLDTTLALASPGQETRAELTLPVNTAEGSSTVEVQLLRESAPLFRGSRQIDLELGERNPVEVSLDPIPARIELDRERRALELGDTLYLGGTPVFATGHEIPGLSLTWSANDGGLIELDAATGRMIGTAEGATIVHGAFAGLEDTMTVTVRSTVTDLAVVLPTEIDLGEDVIAQARVRDKRGNLLTRVLEWSSSDTRVATVDANGQVRGVGEGTTMITGTAEGVSGSATLRVRRCLAAPPPLAENPFRVSGSVARSSGDQVDVVLNPIIVNGNPVTGLDESNFIVVEDGCARPFTVTTSEGAIGVDLVFIQDLSGSMGGAITGVRESVISFAEQLATRGLDIRIGSVGYSGPSTIPSTPAGSYSEYLGPVQDLATPAEFQAHVAAQWYASGGGDAPENGLEAIEYAHRNLSWRPGATRVMIMITDISQHWSGSGCGCSDQSLESIVELIGSSTVVHVVAPADDYLRTYPPGMDPWLLADATGGVRLALGSGVLDLNALEIESVLAETIRLTFQSASTESVPHDLRVRVTLPDGTASELVADGIRYDPLDVELRMQRFPGR